MFLTLTMVCWAVSVVCQTRLATWLVSRGQPSRAIPESTWRLNEQRHRRGLLSLKPSDDRGVRGQSMIAGRVHFRLGEGVRMPAACETAALISRPRTTAYLSEIPPPDMRLHHLWHFSPQHTTCGGVRSNRQTQFQLDRPPCRQVSFLRRKRCMSRCTSRGKYD